MQTAVNYSFFFMISRLTNNLVAGSIYRFYYSFWFVLG